MNTVISENDLMKTSEIKVEEIFQSLKEQLTSNNDIQNTNDTTFSTPESNTRTSLTSPQEKPRETKGNSKSQRFRRVITETQKKVLVASYSQSKYPNLKQRSKIGIAIGLDATQVQFWFQNRRMKEKVAPVQSNVKSTTLLGDDPSQKLLLQQITSFHKQSSKIKASNDITKEEEHFRRNSKLTNEITSLKRSQYEPISPEDVSNCTEAQASNVVTTSSSSKRKRNKSVFSMFDPEESLEQDEVSMSEDDIQKSIRTRKRKIMSENHRSVIDENQKIALQELYLETRFPDLKTRQEIGSAIGLAPRKVQIWFQNKRMKEKKDGSFQERPMQSRKPYWNGRTIKEQHYPKHKPNPLLETDIFNKVLSASLTRTNKSLAPSSLEKDPLFVENNEIQCSLSKLRENTETTDTNKIQSSEIFLLKEEIKDLKLNQGNLISKTTELEKMLLKASNDLKSLLSSITTLESEVARLNRQHNSAVT